MTSPRRIDVHFHLIPPFYREAVYAAGRGPAIGRYPEWTPQLGLDLMDAYGIEVALTSLAQPGVGFGSEASARALARRCNDYAAEFIARWPKRFGAFGTVPMGSMQEIDADVVALQEADKRIGGRGSTVPHELIDSHGLYNPVHFGVRHRRVFDKARKHTDRLLKVNTRNIGWHGNAILVKRHVGVLDCAALALPWPGFIMEYLFDTTRAAVNLIFSGALERFPRIRFILPHAGGLVPYFAWRLSVSPIIDPRLPQLSREQVHAALKHFWYDNALSPGEQTFGALDHVASPERVVFGSDYPFANARVIAEMVKTFESGFLSEGRRVQIDRGNALALFPKYS